MLWMLLMDSLIKNRVSLFFGCLSLLMLFDSYMRQGKQLVKIEILPEICHLTRLSQKFTHTHTRICSTNWSLIKISQLWWVYDFFFQHCHEECAWDFVVVGDGRVRLFMLKTLCKSFAVYAVVFRLQTSMIVNRCHLQ